MTQEIIKFLTAGNVDDGKSTLIGKLLYDTDSLYEDQIAEVKKSTDNSFKGGSLDFSLFLDGLLSERSQKITIDVAYRYFSYGERKFIIADAPGHEQYTKNMAVAAANSNISIILIDVKKGIKTQTIRHSYIAHLFGIKNIIVAVNKMDLVDFDQKVFEDLKKDYLDKVKDLGFESIDFVPISAIGGDNIVKTNPDISWYQGKSIMEYLIAIQASRSDENITRLQIQNVIKDDPKRYYQGLLSSGVLNVGDDVMTYQGRKQAKIVKIIHSSQEVQSASAGDSILVEIDKDVDLDRGGLISGLENKPYFAGSFGAYIVWFSDRQFDIDNQDEYIIKLNHGYIRVNIDSISHLVNIENLQKERGTTIKQNHIAHVNLSLAKDVVFDLFKTNQKTGSFFLINKNTNETLACGIIASCAFGEINVEGQKSNFVSKLTKFIKNIIK
jgi:sulfate adenylyltransferase large subunit